VVQGTMGEVPQLQAVARVTERMDETAANAHLIAAAPELLAALHQAVAIIRVFVDVDDTRWSHLRDAAELQAIEAAIAKAEGAR